jgi:hypothetical protein
MPSDRSRRTDTLRDGYSGVVAQQGRVILDRDFNALQGLTAERIARDALDFVGPCGTPDDGFRISLPQASPPGPPLWSPPASLGTASRDERDFLIVPGTMYVGGQRAELFGRQAGHAITYSYFDQPDWLNPPDPLDLVVRRLDIVNRPRLVRELVYLELAEQEVSAVEDPELLDVALGGPDTTQRIKLMRRVKREFVTGPDCATAWSEATALWQQRDGVHLDPATMRLLPAVRLQVGFTQDVAASNPCDPVATGGYLGADNQLIRVQISDAGTPQRGAASLLWGYDNASFLYRVTGTSGGGTQLTLAQDPPDAFHMPQTGQLVEILRTAAVLGQEPDASDPTGRGAIVRVVAEARGELRRLKQPYGPVVSGDPTSYLVLDSPLPDAYVNDAAPLFVRVWQAELNFQPSGDTVELTDPASGTTTGVQVTISLPPGEVLTVGAFWQLALRPATPQGVYPERLLAAPQPPDGPNRWACPLAVIDWTNQDGVQVTDCRQSFDSLVELSRRRPGCCTISVGPADVAAAGGLQTVLDRAAGLGLGTTVCLASGVYNLARPLRLGTAHAGLTIEACGVGAVLQADANADPGAFGDGLIVLSRASLVTLRGLDLAPVQAPLPSAAAAGLLALLSGFTSAEVAKTVVIAMRAMIGIRIIGSGSVTVEDCLIAFRRVDTHGNDNVFGAGVFLQGNCSGFTLRRSSLSSSVAPTFQPIQLPTLGVAVGVVAASATPSVASAAASASALAAVPAAAATVPADTSAALLARARVGIQTVVSRAEAAEERLIMTVGLLADTLLGPAGANSAPLTCALGDVTIRENRFAGFTFAGYCLADANTARVQDNTITHCVAGIWLELPEWQQPNSDDRIATALFTARWNALHAFGERLALDALALTYPLPAGVTVTNPLLSGGTAFFVLNNQIEALGTPIGTAAFLLLANRAVSTTIDTSVSLLMTGNRLRSRAGPTIPTAFVLLPDAENCAMAGNLVINERTTPTNPESGGPSLWLVPNTATKGVQMLSVAGNVLIGPSTIAQLTRVNVSPAQSWALYNANPS